MSIKKLSLFKNLNNVIQDSSYVFLISIKKYRKYVGTTFFTQVDHFTKFQDIYTKNMESPLLCCIQSLIIRSNFLSILIYSTMLF